MQRLTLGEEGLEVGDVVTQHVLVGGKRTVGHQHEVHVAQVRLVEMPVH